MEGKHQSTRSRTTESIYSTPYEKLYSLAELESVAMFAVAKSDFQKAREIKDYIDEPAEKLRAEAAKYETASYEINFQMERISNGN
jgi:hypothetical protein